MAPQFSSAAIELSRNLAQRIGIQITVFNTGIGTDIQKKHIYEARVFDSAALTLYDERLEGVCRILLQRTDTTNPRVGSCTRTTDEYETNVAVQRVFGLSVTTVRYTVGRIQMMKHVNNSRAAQMGTGAPFCVSLTLSGEQPGVVTPRGD
ncbi:hypothetical protein K432DRAFT_423731 [Lepidopterella palustris CBS 459.81]|uniref:Uncharacterized protein n=1 Tax=Lepidopterella palustris CBS 459.81 TaxID=1314670 RepID=A0A8E2JHM0_9PEZI|nr:hypothetical protein K432DRAFT_423731 [Lepidopterella palustris CBS 459.81]